MIKAKFMSCMRVARSYVAAALITAAIGGVVANVTVPQVAMAADDCNQSVLGFRPWYYKLTESASKSCDIMDPSKATGGLRGFLFQLASNIVDIGLMLVVYTSIVFVLYGGFQFILSVGKPDDISKAKKTIQYALVGLIISVSAVGIVRFIAGSM